jgi:VWA domain-containing protein
MPVPYPEVEMERLHKSSRRLIWLNSLLRFEGYAPLATGARAIIRPVDDFRPIHNLESLSDLTAALSDIAPRRQEGLSNWGAMPSGAIAIPSGTNPISARALVRVGLSSGSIAFRDAMIRKSGKAKLVRAADHQTSGGRHLTVRTAS